jgi:hypothetical protein
LRAIPRTVLIAAAVLGILLLSANGFASPLFAHSTSDPSQPSPTKTGLHAIAGFSAPTPVWVIETVDQTDSVGRFSSLALDADGQPHISYYDDTNDDLKYAHYDGISWQIETVDGADVVGRFSSLALDATGRPHISYCRWMYTPYEHSCVDLKYAYYDGATWQIETVETGSLPLFPGWYTSIALDSAGWPHISYGAFYCTGGSPGVPFVCDPDTLKYARYDGTNWQIETVDSTGWTGIDTSLALDTLDRPHISYFNDSSNQLKYAYYDGTSWHIETVDNANGYTSLALDSADRPHISYRNSGLNYAHYDGTVWQIQWLDSGGAHSSLVLDVGGRPHISYLNGSDLKYGWYDGATWQSQIVESAGWVGYYTSLALNVDGYVHISYYNATNDDLKYAHQICAPVEGVQVAGPLALLANQTGIYQATAQPITASLPITFTWNNGSIAPTATYSWSITGSYTLTVTGTNGCGQGWGSLVVQVLQEWPYSIYLPVVMRSGQETK